MATGRPQEAPGSRAQRGLDDGAGAHITLAPLPVAPLTPRLLDLRAASTYLALSLYLVRELVATGRLPRVSVPLPPDRRGRRKDGVVRKVLLDVRDVDAMIDRLKDAGRLS